MRRILLVPEGLDLPLDAVDESTREPLSDVAARYHVVIPADHMGTPPMLSEGIRAAFLCTDLDAFDRLHRMAIPGDLLFMPSAVARLDLLRRGRRTLACGRPLTAGTVLADADLAVVDNGSGIGVGLRDQVVGRRVLYDLPEGAPIDFGMIDEDPVADTGSGGRS